MQGCLLPPLPEERCLSPGASARSRGLGLPPWKPPPPRLEAEPQAQWWPLLPPGPRPQVPSVGAAALSLLLLWASFGVCLSLFLRRPQLFSGIHWTRVT